MGKLKCLNDITPTPIVAQLKIGDTLKEIEKLFESAQLNATDEFDLKLHINIKHWVICYNENDQNFEDAIAAVTSARDLIAYFTNTHSAKLLEHICGFGAHLWLEHIYGAHLWSTFVERNCVMLDSNREVH